MFEDGKLLKFTPFIFKNGATPKPKYFIVLKNISGDLLLATLPTSKDHVPSDIPVKWGCIEIPERCVNVFVFTADTEITVAATNNGYSFPLNTFVYGADLDTYPASVFEQQKANGETMIQEIGTLKPEIFDELVRCLKASVLVKNKYRKLL